jgi:large subunit ribosomal protein L25
MPDITLVAESRDVTGSSDSRRSRREGRIPAVVYGHGLEPLSITVDARELRVALSTSAGLNQLLNINVGGNTHLALARELQRHPVRHTVAHVDFQIVRRDEVVRSEVPVVITGEALAVNRAGGVLEHVISTLTVHSTPANIPNEITVDVSELNVGDSIRIGDLKLPSGVSTDLDPDEVLVIAAFGAVQVEAEGEAAEGEAAESAEGEAAASEPAGTEES